MLFRSHHPHDRHIHLIQQEAEVGGGDVEGFHGMRYGPAQDERVFRTLVVALWPFEYTRGNGAAPAAFLLRLRCCSDRNLVHVLGSKTLCSKGSGRPLDQYVGLWVLSFVVLCVAICGGSAVSGVP